MTTETVSATSLTKADRLSIGGAVAPVVRRAADAPRRVTIINKDGSPVGVTDSVNVAKSMLARADIEFSVQEGKRPEFVKCKACGRPVKVRRSGVLPEVCHKGTHKCACGRTILTSGCGFGKLCRQCVTLVNAERLKAIPVAERSERSTKTRLAEWEKLTPEQRTERGKKAAAKRSPEERREGARIAGKAAMAKLSPEERMARMERMRASLTPEARRQAAANMRAATTPEQRSAAVRKAHERMTPEQRAERSRKMKAAWVSRRQGRAPHTCACGVALRHRESTRCRECWKKRGPD